MIAVRSGRVAVENMLDHAAGELVLAEENFAGFSFSSSAASSSLCVRTTVSMRGLTVRAISIMRRTSRVSGVAITSIRARWTWA